MKRNKHQSEVDFKMMSFFFKVRDTFKSPLEKVRKAKIEEGFHVLDYGCGPGSYTVVAAEKVGPKGRVYAADIHPLALEKVKERAVKKGLQNIDVIQTDCYTNLDNESIDVIMCFDVFHDIMDKSDLLKEFHRVLKSNGTLSFDDHHLKEEEIITLITSEKLFKLSEKQDKQFNFIKLIE